MQDVVFGGYLLYVVGVQIVVIVVVVVVLYVFGEYVGDCFEVVVWMFGEVCDVVVGLVGVEFVQQQEWVEYVQCGLFDDVFEFYVCVVGGVYVVDVMENVVFGYDGFYVEGDCDKMCVGE